MKKELGEEYKSILINDSFDPFTKLYYTRLINYNPSFKYFEQEIGKPITNLPDIEGVSFIDFFENLLREKLVNLNINLKIVRFSDELNKSKYLRYKMNLLDNEKQIIEKMNNKFSKKVKTIYRPICQQCGRIDTTSYSHENTKVSCSNCENSYSVKEVPQGKFIWPIDCAIRWNLFNVDFEPFTINYLTKEIGSYFISLWISKYYLDNKRPFTTQFSYFKFSLNSDNISKCLPFYLLEDIFSTNLDRAEFPTDKEIISRLKDYKIHGVSFLHMAELIHVFEQTYFYDNKTYNHLNHIFFESKLKFPELIKIVELCRNFSKKYFKHKNQMIPIEKVDFMNFETNILKNFVNALKGENYNPKLLSQIYPVFFSGTKGPHIKTINKCLAKNYKKQIIQIMGEYIEQTNT